MCSLLVCLPKLSHLTASVKETTKRLEAADPICCTNSPSLIVVKPDCETCLWAIYELLFVSVSKRVLVQKISFIHMQSFVNLHANKTNFHMKGFALGLALEPTQKATRKSPMSQDLTQHYAQEVGRFYWDTSCACIVNSRPSEGYQGCVNLCIFRGNNFSLQYASLKHTRTHARMHTHAHARAHKQTNKQTQTQGTRFVHLFFLFCHDFLLFKEKKFLICTKYQPAGNSEKSLITKTTNREHGAP